MSSANYIAEADKRAIDINYVIEIEGVTTSFSKKNISGFGGSQEPSAIAMKWNPPKLSIDNTKISIGTIDVTLIDPNATIMDAIAVESIHRKELTLKRGFTNLDVADYDTVAVFKIYEVNAKDENTIHIKGRDRIADLSAGVSFDKTILAVLLTDVATTMTVDSTDGFPASGTLFIEDEKITYTSKDPVNFFGLVRGSTPEEHDIGADIVELITLTANPVDIMLQILTSSGGGGAYDVLDYGLAIPVADIDVASFEGVRDDSSLTGNTWKFEFTDDIKSILAFFQKDVFQFSNTRLYVNDSGQIACALFQEITLDQYAGPLGEEDIQPLPTVISNSDRLVNRIRVKYDLDPETGKYSKEATFNDTETDSQAVFGVLEGKAVFEARGLRAGLNGSLLAQNFANRYFRRVAQPFGRIKKVTCLWKKQFFKAGDKVTFTHPDIFDLVNGVKGIDKQTVEVNSVKYDMDVGRVTYEINNSPSLSARFGFISPSSTIDSGTSTTVFDLTAGEAVRAEWEVGAYIDLFDTVLGSDVSADHEITDITGEQITVTPAMSVTPDASHSIRYSVYTSATNDQKLFAFSTDNDNNFPSDNAESYKVS
jgi:hypothetical protein